jgi:hypothetical protein
MAILVLTSARQTERPFGYLEKTVAQIDAEEIAVEKVIVCDGRYTGPEFKGWRVVEYEKPENSIKGNKLAYWRLLEEGVALGGEVVALEDDITFGLNGLRRIVAFLIPRDLAWVQFFSPMILRQKESWPGLWRPPPYSALFLQAVKWSAAGARAMLSWRDHGEFVIHGESDQTVNLAAMRLGLRYGVHCPDLVDHVGAVSLVSGGDELNNWRTSQCFAPRLDALRLFNRDDLYR